MSINPQGDNELMPGISHTDITRNSRVVVLKKFADIIPSRNNTTRKTIKETFNY